MIRLIIEVKFNNGEIKCFTGIGETDGLALKIASELIAIYCEKNHCFVISQRLKTKI